jgi:hypothetical protein
MYLSREFFGWPYGDYEGTGIDFDKLTRAHDIWRHAKKRLDSDASEFEKIDCITSLKRAVNSRLKTITTIYGINELPNTRGKKQLLEKFQDYGIIRPAILKDLFELRNLLEHEDVDPPDIEKCHYYVDIVWYFIKSTDSLLQMKSDALEYSEEKNQLYVKIKPENSWSIYISGEVSSSLISEEEQPNTVKIEELKVKKVKNKPEMLSFSGKPKMDDDLLIKFAREYFGAMGYWYEDHADQ